MTTARWRSGGWILLLCLYPAMAWAGDERSHSGEAEWWLVALFTLQGMVLVFVVPFIPMSDRDVGLFAEDEDHRPDSINLFEQSHKPLVDMGLFYFGLANAGVAWWGSTVWDQNSWAVFLGLGIGKTLGITGFTLLGFLLLKLVTGKASLPENVETGERLLWRDVPLVGLLGAMGFTVALFTAEAAGGLAPLKLGAIASVVYLGLAVLLGIILAQRQQNHGKTN